MCASLLQAGIPGTGSRPTCRRSREFGVPGLANFDVQGWVGLFAPAGTPTPVVDIISKAFLKNLSVLDKLVFEQGMLTFSLEPAQFAAFVKADSLKWRRTIEEAKIEIPLRSDLLPRPCSEVA